MEILSSNITLNTPSIKFQQPYSLQIFFKENKSFFINQVNQEAGNPLLTITEEPLEGVEPEMKITVNATIAEGIRFLDAGNIQTRMIPHADKKKAVILLASVLGC